MASEFAKVSVSLPADLVERVKSRAGVRGMSHYVAQALEEDERRAALRAWLSSQDAEYGPVSDEVMEEVRRHYGRSA